MNPDLDRLKPYPFEKLRTLLADITPNPGLPVVRLSIGEPQHATPAVITEALTRHLHELAHYPSTQGSPALRQAIAGWIARRYGTPLDAEAQVLPVNGSREALFAFAQTVIDATRPDPLVVCPNPFYQIYEGAALLAGARPVFLNNLPENGFRMDFASLSEADWKRVQLVYVCSPGNPTGKIMDLEEWRQLFALSERHGFVIASDECYSEIYFDEGAAPLGALDAASRLGLAGFPRLVVFSSLSKRSNVPGLRSGFVAGDAAILKKFLLYRTYHGSAMSPAAQAASIAAWNDEAHVIDNRRQYREKFAAVQPIVAGVLDAPMPEAGFYLWASVGRYPGMSDTDFARGLLRDYNVAVLPGSLLARESGGVNPGAGFVRIALVAPLAECREAAERIALYAKSL